MFVVGYIRRSDLAEGLRAAMEHNPSVGAQTPVVLQDQHKR